MEFVHVQLDAFAQSTVRFLIPSAEPDWRLSPHPALPLWSISSHTLGAFLPIASASPVHARWTAGAFAASLCSGSFPQAGGLRHPSSSWCARLSRTPTTLPPLTSQEGIGFSSGSRLPTSTILPILPGISRVPTVGRKRDEVGGVFPWCPFRSLRLPRLCTG
jgi:hypothetical protein